MAFELRFTRSLILRSFTLRKLTCLSPLLLLLLRHVLRGHEGAHPFSTCSNVLLSVDENDLAFAAIQNRRTRFPRSWFLFPNVMRLLALSSRTIFSGTGEQNKAPRTSPGRVACVEVVSHFKRLWIDCAQSSVLAGPNGSA